MLIHNVYFLYLEELDEKEISELSRQFLINWKATKDAKKKITDGRIMNGHIMYPFSGIDISFWILDFKKPTF